MTSYQDPSQSERPEISFVIPCYNEEENVRAICAAVIAEAKQHARSYEIILIDNASTDRTREIIRELCAENPLIRAIFNNRNYGQMRSPTYAIYQARGEAIIGLCADFQDPPALIGELIRQWKAGAQIVLGQRRSERASWPVRLSRRIGYGLLARIADYPVIRGATGFGLFSREAIDMLSTWNEPEPFLRGMMVESGYRLAVVSYDRPPRAAGETKNNLKTLTDFALSGLAGSSKALLRLPYIVFVYAAAASLLLAIGTIAAFLAGAATWQWLVMTTLFAMFSMLMLFIGMIGDQVRLIAERTRNVPLVIEEERINFGPVPAPRGPRCR